MLPITSTFAAIAAAALVALSLPVSLRRMKTRIASAMDGDESLARRIRAQGNFIEYAPLALIVLGLAEANAVAAGLLWALGAVLAAGRTAHAFGMLRGSTPLRAVGMVLTYTTLLVGAGALPTRIYG